MIQLVEIAINLLKIRFNPRKIKDKIKFQVGYDKELRRVLPDDFPQNADCVDRSWISRVLSTGIAERFDGFFRHPRGRIARLGFQILAFNLSKRRGLGLLVKHRRPEPPSNRLFDFFNHQLKRRVAPS